MKKNKNFIFSFAFLCVFIFLATVNCFADDILNTLTINSIDFENKAVYGFVYEIKEKTTMNTVARADMRMSNTWQTQLKDGEYVIVEIERPEGYDKAKDVNITLPYKMGNNGVTRGVSFTPKHVLKADKPQPQTPPNKDVPPGVRTGDYVNLMFYLGILLIGLGLVGLFRDKKPCERLRI